MSRGMSRAERLREMERLYVDRAFSDIEMAERLGVDRVTVYKDRATLETEVPFVPVERGQWKIDRTKYLSSIRLSLHEALALYLPARRAARQTLIAQPHVANALEKLAVTLKQPMTERLVQAANQILAQSAQPERVAIMETVARGWIERHKVRIAYRGLHARQAGNHLISPYLIEPALWSDGAYVIGHSDFFDDIAVFKIERIERATLTDESFDIPQHFDEQELLRYAWGIWRGEGEPERVVLRFAPGDATRRLKESIWHPQQEPLVDTPEGGCIWAARVSEPREMLPWIRGWGADCEVLEPKELREAIMREVNQMSIVYCLTRSETLPPYRLLWAKTDRDTGKRHLLLYHLVDVALTARALWRDGVPEPVRGQVSEWLGLDQDAAGRLIALWVGLHDLGKASPIFQDHPRMNDTLRQRIKRELQAGGFEFRTFTGFTRHEIISTWALDKQGLLKSETGTDPRFARRIAAAVGGHHGDLPRAGALEPELLPIDHRGGATWEAARLELFRELKRELKPPDNVKAELEVAQENALLILLAGLVSVADWIGSNEKYFRYEEGFVETSLYAQRAADQADDALKQLGWLIRPELSGLLSFESLFAVSPRPIQEKTIQSAEIETPALVILEAPTGIGKTEAALYLAERWTQQGAQAGLYVAMPTQATSNQMFERVTRCLRARYPNEMVNLLLVHGQAGRQHAFAETLAETVEDVGDNRVAALSWFTDRKRSLLAQFGIGTVDQTFMAVLQTKWFFTRLLGLSRKVVIFDEVHAYDTYMSTLFVRLLEWLREIGASVIVLSATLPVEARQKLVAAYLGKDVITLDKQPYPRVTVASAAIGEPTVTSLPQPPERTLRWEWTGRAPEAIAQTLDTELRDGGCAAVICNTVERAQAVYEALCKAQDNCDVILFHARYPLCWRRATETDVLDKFSVPDKHGNDSPKRPPKSVIVATQVIEQSLDLDFDMMITDLAPVDLLIQRAGRLHRHKRNARKGQDRLLITRPEIVDGVPQFEKDVWVYEPYLLLRTWVTLLDTCYADTFHLPRDTDNLIERVYGASEIESGLGASLRDALAATKRKMEKEIEDAEREANARLVLAPDKESMLFPPQEGLEEDNPTVHRAFQALTRKDGPGLQVICLHRTTRGLTLEPNGTGIVINLEQKPTREEIDALLDYAINIHHGAVVQHFLARDDALPAIWKRTPALRYHRVAIFEGGAYEEIEKYRLVLSRHLGLQIIKKEGA